MYAYIDESGDVGITKKSSKYFVLVAVIVGDGISLEREVRKYMAKLLKINKNRPSYFHANKESNSVLEKLINISTKYNVQTIAYIYDNKKANQYIESVGKMIYELKSIGVINITLARFQSSDKVLKIFKDDKKLKVSIHLAQNNKGIQMADCYSYLIYSKLHNKHTKLFEMIKDKIVNKQNP